MTSGAPPDDLADRLLALALSRPREAFDEAGRLLAGDPSDLVASIARQTRAIVWRDQGRVAEALPELRDAVRLAARTGDPERLTDVEATLGLTLGLTGRAADGLRMIGRAADRLGGVPRGRVLLRRRSCCGCSAGTTRRWPTCRPRSASCSGAATASGRRAPSPTGSWCTPRWARPAGPTRTWWWPRRSVVANR